MTRVVQPGLPQCLGARGIEVYPLVYCVWGVEDFLGLAYSLLYQIGEV